MTINTEDLYTREDYNLDNREARELFLKLVARILDNALDRDGATVYYDNEDGLIYADKSTDDVMAIQDVNLGSINKGYLPK